MKHKKRRKREQKLRLKKSHKDDWKNRSPSDLRDGRFQIILVLTLALIGAGVVLYNL